MSAGLGRLAARGVSLVAWSDQFHGDFDYAYFDGASLSTLDYCSADSSQKD